MPITNLGKKFPKEWREKIRKSLKAKYQRGELKGTFQKGHQLGFKKGVSAWNKGKKGNFENQNTKGLKLGRGWNKGKPAPWAKPPILYGEKSSNWKGGVSKQKEYASFKASKRRIRKLGNGGSHTIEQWKRLKKFYNYMCLCCKRFEPEIKLERDHIVPVSFGGSDDIENIQPLCRSCNSKKQTKDTCYRCQAMVSQGPNGESGHVCWPIINLQI